MMSAFTHLIQHDVLRFEIAVNQTAGMRVIERSGTLLKKA
jgi:hypothetical protein